MAVVRLSVRELVEFLLQSGSIDSRFTGFDRANEGARIHRRLQKAAGDGYEAEVPFVLHRTVCDIDYCIEGRADGIYSDEDGYVVVDEIKTTATPSDLITEDYNPCHWAQGMVYAAALCQQRSLTTVRVRLTYFQIDEERIIRFVREYTAADLEAFFCDLLTRYAPWAQRRADWYAHRQTSLRQLAFPFAEYRAGQRAMAGAVYKNCRDGKDADGGGRLFCQAPTGIGKTMSTIFPALRAMGEEKGEKLFYLTARTTTRAAAENAVAALKSTQSDLCLKSITLTAKDKICLQTNAAGRPECTPIACPYAKGYYDRIRVALADVLDHTHDLTRSALTEYAIKHRVCPFELGLDLSEWCDLVICDYNYLFDPTAALHRFFDSTGDWIFLIDEAHNLPDRAREMHSASFAKSSLLEAKKALGRSGSRAKKAVQQANEILLAYRKLCDGSGNDCRDVADYAFAAPSHGAEQLSLMEETAAETVRKSHRGKTVLTDEQLLDGQTPLDQGKGTIYLKKLPEPLAKALAKLAAPLEAWLENHHEGEGHDTVLQLYFDLKAFNRTAEAYDDHYVTQLTAHGSELRVSLLCLDPSAFVDKSLALGRAAVLFSATLSPPGYYKTVLGCRDARAVALQSPFPAQNLALYTVPVSTRYANRSASLVPVADWLAAMCSGKTGNYLAFFPSYAYLQQVYEVFCTRHPEIATLVQQSNATDAERTAFLERFSPAPDATLLGFGVLGGVFGEGVDLAGDRLIGCAVVGVGLPQVNPRQEMLRRYFDEKNGQGFDFAYRYPGMNKVLQAAGRVIRTPEDKGVVLLIDDRFDQSDYSRLLPAHWSHRQTLHTPEQLRSSLQAFWAED